MNTITHVGVGTSFDQAHQVPLKSFSHLHGTGVTVADLNAAMAEPAELYRATSCVVGARQG